MTRKERAITEAMQRFGYVVNPCVHRYATPPSDIGTELAKVYQATLEEPTPDWAKDLLAKLK